MLTDNYIVTEAQETVKSRPGHGVAGLAGLATQGRRGQRALGGDGVGFIKSHITEQPQFVAPSGFSLISASNLQLTRWHWGRVHIFKTDTRVGRKFPNRSAVGGGVRGTITHLSGAARQRLLFIARNCDGLVTEVTLTYPGKFPTDGRLVKYHVKRTLQQLRRYGLCGLWFLEFQKRGAPHFHLFVDGFVDKAWLSFTWFSIVNSGDDRHLVAGTEVSRIRKPHAVAAYAAKYAAKMAQKQVPETYSEVGRFWGRFGGLKVRGTELVIGRVETIAPQLRLVRRFYQAERRSWPVKAGRRIRRFRDNGKFSFIAWGCGGDWYHRCSVFDEVLDVIERREVTF